MGMMTHSQALVQDSLDLLEDYIVDLRLVKEATEAAINDGKLTGRETWAEAHGKISLEAWCSKLSVERFRIAWGTLRMLPSQIGLSVYEGVLGE